MQAIIDILKNNNSFIVVAHEKPDGDAIGSVTGLTAFLNDNGKKATALLVDDIPTKFEDIISCPLTRMISANEINSADILIILDSARSSRINLPSNINIDEIKIPIVNIDHHIDNNVNGTVNYINSAAGATAEIIADLAKKMEVSNHWIVSRNCAEMLYLGIVTDTGSFKFTNTTCNTFQAAAYLLSKGVDINKINNAAYFSKALNQLLFEAEMINNHLKCDFDGRYAHAIIPQSLFDKYQFNMKDGETVIEYLREINTAVIAALLYPKDSAVKVSLRSKNSAYPVGPIARKFNGGGHEMAAGITFENKSFEEVDKLLYDAIKEVLEKNEI
ncbi:MAG: bifunctional oligoribonuclease/PAP phosphatase NrnA [Lentisphaeria bacterium]|nr:bifunctional oligoribonuclease/PAP phosphatase NrnA [Lentisphaeria bacterium]